MPHTDTRLWMPNPVKLPDDHTLFQATDLGIKAFKYPRAIASNDDIGAWAVADESGGFPDETDDGVCWLDFSTRIMLGTGNRHPTIPIITREGRRVFVTDAASLLIISDMFRWNINIYPGTLYRAVRL